MEVTHKGKAWKYELDYIAVCGITHTLLHGTYLQLCFDHTQSKWKPKLPFKRYWKKDVWEEFFQTLLNSTPNQRLDLSSLITYFCEKF